MGLLPIPFTVIVCYPPGIVLGIISLVYGMIALREIRAEGKRGQAACVGGDLVGRLHAICCCLYDHSGDFDISKIYGYRKRVSGINCDLNPS